MKTASWLRNAIGTAALGGLALSMPSPELDAQEMAIGSVYGRGSGISMTYRKEKNTSLHLSARVFSRDFLAVEFSHMRYFNPKWYQGWDLPGQWYSAIGLEGSADKQRAGEEEYRLVWPVGLEWQPQDSFMQVFVDQSLLLGPLPVTRIIGRAQIGLRATF